MALSAKHQQFVEEYLRCFNATRAYQAVYPTVGRLTAASNGYRLLKENPEVAEYVQQRLTETAMSADEVLMRMAEQARGNMGDFIRVTPDGSFTIDLTGAESTQKLGLIRKVTKTVRRFGDTEIEEATVDLYDSQAALVHLGKHLDLFSDKLTVKLEKELKGALDALEKSLDSDTYAKALTVLAGKLGGAEAEGD